MTLGYAICLSLAIGLLIAYFSMMKEKPFWLTMLYFCVPIVNLGYLLLSLAKSLSFAIFANDVAYFGSVFLSMCMLFTIVRLSGFKVERWHVVVCLTLAVVMFSIVATSGFLPWYYKSVSLETVDGTGKLVKEYGPLHDLYLVYLLAYFAAMIATIVRSVVKKKPGAAKFAGFIAGVVCSNLIVWIFEKFVEWEFEFLSVTYIISELLLLLVFWMMQDYVLKSDLPIDSSTERALGVEITAMSIEEKLSRVLLCVKDELPLGIREREILELILKNSKRREIAESLHLSENTVKTYTRTLYAKLGVSCREELFALLLQTQN